MQTHNNFILFARESENFCLVVVVVVASILVTK